MNKIYKLIGANVLVALLAWKFFRYVDYVLNVITPESFSFDFAALGASLASWREPVAMVNFIFLVSIISLGLAIFRKKRWALVMTGVVGLVYLLTFGWDYINLIGLGITALLFLSARHDGIEEIDQRMKINPRMIVRRSASAVVLAFFILLSFVAFQSPVAKGISTAQQLPSASEQLMRSIVASVIGGQIEASEQQKENIINEVAGRTFNQINNLLKPYFRYAPPLLAFGLFLILWGLSWFFIQLSVLVGILIFWILNKTKFIKIEERDMKAEVLVV